VTADPAIAALEERIAGSDWGRVSETLTERGYALLPGLLPARACQQLADLYEADDLFRSTVAMERHRFGVGEYRYFENPLPPLVQAARRTLYRPLAAIANRWQEMLGEAERFPDRLEDFLDRCHRAGQQRPTPLLLRYESCGYNCLHQDLYGSVAFPLQVAVLLSQPGEDFEGGEFLLVEQRPRQQSRGHAIALERGQAIVFPNAVRPAQGVRGPHRVKVRHGVSDIRSGRRLTLGLIFHDAS